jgi:glycosyltransferase involved in cell wall biosynthesis
LKIVHVVLGKANPDRMNGVNKAVHNLAIAQVARGDDAEVWGLTADPGAPTPPREYTLRLFPAFRGGVVPPRPLVEALGAVPAGSVFHLHGCFIPAFAILAALLRRNGLPYVLTTHGSLSPAAMRTNALVKSAYFRLVERRLLSGASGVHVVGGTEWEHLRVMLPRARGFLIPNGQRRSEVAFDGPPADRPTRPVFGFCGRIEWEHKGIDLLVEGFARYKHDGGAGELWLIGSGDDLVRSKALAASRGVSAATTFFGPLFGDAKLRRVAAMDAFLHTSRFEGFPMSVLEAAALARPLIVSVGTNVGEYVERFEAGSVLAENSPEEIAAAMLEVERGLSSGRCELWGRNAARMIDEELNWPRVAARLAEEYPKR